jgi:trimeric autotransporter adhesin
MGDGLGLTTDDLAAEAAEYAEAKAAGAATQTEGAIRKTHAALSNGKSNGRAAGEGKETSAAVAAASAAALTAAAAAEAATLAAGRAEAQRVEAAAAAAAAAEAAYDPEASAEAEEALSEVVLASAASKQAAAEAAMAKGAAEMAAASAADAAAAAEAIDGHPVAESSPASEASVRAAKIATEARTGATNSAIAAAAAGSAAADATVGMGVAAAAEAAEAESEAAEAAAEAAEAAEAAWRSADAAAFAACIASQRAAAAEAAAEIAAAADEADTAAVEATSSPELPAAAAQPSPNCPSPHLASPSAARPPPPPYAHPEQRAGMTWAQSHPWASTNGVPPRRSTCAASAAAAAAATAAARTKRASTGGSAGGGAAASTLPVLDWSRRDLTSTMLEAAGDLSAAMAAKAPGTLWLHDNEITSEGGAMLGALLSSARGTTARPVRRLGLSGNMLSDTGVASLLHTLSPEVGATLDALGLANNGLGAPSAAALANALSEGGKLSGLLELKLGGNNLGDGGGVALARALRSPGCKLHTLHLGFSAVGEAGGVAIAEAIGGLQSTEDAPTASSDEGAAWLPLRSLQLQSNELGTNAAAALAQALRSPRCGLISLWLGGNTLGASGAAAVADALCCSRSMRQLRLENTGLDDRSASGLAAAIVTPECPIAELWMGGSALTDAGAAVIAGALFDRSEADEAAALASGRGDVAAAGHSRSSLCKLWLDHGSLLRPSGASALVEAARRHGAPLEQLWLGGPAIGPEDTEALLNLAQGGGAAEGAEAAGQPAVEAQAEGGASEAPHSSRPPLRLLLNQQARPALAPAEEATSTARGVLRANSACVAGAAAAPAAEAPSAEAPVAEPQPEVTWEAPAPEVTAPEMCEETAEPAAAEPAA